MQTDRPENNRGDDAFSPDGVASGRADGLPGSTPDEVLAFPTDPVDQAAVAAIGGDAGALQRVWESNRRWIAGILLAHKPSWVDLEDLLQEVAISMVRKLGEVRDPRAVRPWLRTVAINAAHAAARSSKRQKRTVRLVGANADDSSAGLHLADDSVDGQSPAMTSVVSDEGRRLMELSHQLPDGYREPLLLKVLQNLSYREIGELMGLPETTVETRIARGRKQLRDLALEASRESE